jgi:hypothetical protein
MKYDYLEINGQKCRIEFNWNTISNFLEDNGLELSAMDELAKMKPSQITQLIHSALKEGARMEKKEFPYSASDVGAGLSIADVNDVLTIFQCHVNRKSSSEPVKKKKLFSRKR